MGFGSMNKRILPKEKVFLEIGSQNNGSTKYNKEPHKPYAKKEEKVVNMDEVSL